MKTQQDFGVEVIRPFQQFQVGFVMYPTAMYREKLIRGRWVRPRTQTDEAAAEDSKPSLDHLRARKQPRLTRGG